MDDTTKNSQPQPQADTMQPAQPQAADPVMQMPAAPVANAMPADPMDSAKVPDLPTAPVVPDPAPTMPGRDVPSPMQQMATNPVPSADSMTQSPAAPIHDMNVPAANLGPVTMEDLMEELQHIEDKLDEMDEKL